MPDVAARHRKKAKMKDLKIKKLMNAARNEAPLEPPFNFSQNVVAAIRRDESQPSISVFDQLGQLFPRIAFSALIVIALCIAGDFYFSGQDTTLKAELEQGTEEWLFAGR